MNNLISTILAILMMIAASMAGYYYLGDSTSEAQARATLVQYMNSGAQIDAALLLYGVDNGGPPPGTGNDQVKALVDAGYLSHQPLGGWYLKIATAYVGNTSYRPLDSVAECRALNIANNSDVTTTAVAAAGGCPPCEDATFNSYPGCINNEAPVGQSSD